MRCALQIVCAWVCWTALAVCARAELLFVASDIYTPAPPVERATELADQLFAKAKQACEAGDVGAALRLANQAVAVDPEHEGARRVLGYRKVGEQWAGGYASRQLERGKAWHPEFGWIEAGTLPRYQAGERPWGKRWISAKEDARRHDDIDDGWRVRTDHFRITTNHSLAAAAQLAARLEIHYQVWQQLFGGFVLTSPELLQRFEGRESSSYRSKPFEVFYYRTREQYNEALIRQQPQIEQTLGIYFDKTRNSHFFAGEEQDAGTLYHEAVHQFFHESQPAARNVGALHNAWLIEGVACYFESLVAHHDNRGRVFFSIGEAEAGRLPAARHRRLVDDYYVPLAELSALGIRQFQKRSDLPRLYSQSAGLATFLMNAEGQKYRTPLVKTLQALYAGRDELSTLQTLTGRTFAQLDQEYLDFLRASQGESGL